MKSYTSEAIKLIVTLLFISAVIILLSVYSIFIHTDNRHSVNTAHTEVITDFPVIVIDPGHGGEDGGAEANGVLEKNINLSISLMLQDYMKISEIPCALTRTQDILLYSDGQENHKKRYDLINRVNFANSYENAVFVSIHQNKFEIPKYKGLQVYYSANNDNSRKLAEIIQSNAGNLLDSNNKREIKQADFRIKVLDMLKIPAVLVECGFLSNPEEASLLNTSEYQKKIAFVTYLSLIDYLYNNGGKYEKQN